MITTRLHPNPRNTSPGGSRELRLLTGAQATLIIAAVIFASGCQHRYLYRPDNMPDVETGRLIIIDEDDGQPHRYPIESVKVSRAQHPDVFGEPTLEETRALAAGQDAEGIEAVEIRVDTGGEVWSDYASTGTLIGVGIGIGLGVLVGSSIAATEPSENSNGVRFAMAGALGLGGAFYGVLIGGLIGAVRTSGTTDRRLD